MKRAWIAFLGTLVLVLPIRIFSMLRYLNPQTGFYSDGGKSVAAASILLVAGAFLTAYFSSRDGRAEISAAPLRNVVAAVLGAVAGIFVLVQSVVGLTAGFFGEGQIFYQIFCGAGILTGAVLMLTAYDLATGLRKIGSHPLLALIPSVWGCLYLVVLFIAYSAVVNLAEDVYHTFTVVFLLLFLFTQAKLFTGIESTKSGKMIYMVGLPAALIALATGIPSSIQFFAAGITAGVVSIGMHMANIALAFYIVAFLSALQAVPAAAETVPAGAVDREDPSQPTALPDTDDQGNKPMLNAEGSISEYAGFLRKACGSGIKFVTAGPSPFYSRNDPTTEES
ncbi:hypothetical protein CAFE_19800 [Caprobacter fermentans]|uniref:Uncharacterized protein n=1 Tax=Caproicibacter fermentans TaxID=2576756 RepID=A0A6N8HZT5_9FIRM|nr:hypothetical protein [Caproicibacter fermentans]MVB11272.1 hypothetical protein [Caproicibacter fermentans]OCN00131.1 hypothetical protein A7X67_17735 [Clostridium sp. W14A]